MLIHQTFTRTSGDFNCNLQQWKIFLCPKLYLEIQKSTFQFALFGSFFREFGIYLGFVA